MTAIKHGIGTAIGVAMITGFTGLILALVLSLASEQMPALKTMGADLRCLAGVPAEDSACVSKKIAALNDQRRALDKERERLGDVIAAQSFVFTQGDRLADRVNLVVGSLYEDAEARTGLIRSFCWAIVDNGGLDPRVGLAVMRGDGRVEALRTGPADLALLGMSARDVDAARSVCPFPQVS